VEKPEQWQRVKEIVGAALERTLTERSAFLDQACGQDKSLRAEVESLLSAHADAGALSESALTTEFDDTPQTFKTIGPYRLLHKLGEGGMGQVWLAEQTAPVRRKVALKLIRVGLYDDSVLRRFQSERQSLAIMNHPAIAKVFDAGATPDGQPYFVMEYVQGVAITDYCDKMKLKIRDRLELFILACEGVQHAHQKAIIHRDLKPANILVVEVDGKPVPRIIDFGLAKPVTPAFSTETMNTQIGSFVGTPGYMSPEQADPAVQDIDTRTDVYSLGVVLYELLTGLLPFDPNLWKRQRLDEVLRQLRDEDPVRPSARVGSDHKSSTSNAAARSTDPGHLVGMLRGDLDWITMKALDKDRNRRYGTPTEIASDITRYLNSEPILARPTSAGYRLQKYVRRHRLGMGIAAGLILLLTSFAAVQATQLRRITRERDRANRIAEFMSSMFKVSNPSEARGNSVTAREILDRASTDIQSGLAKDPELQAQMMDLMGNVYMSLGLYPRAQSLLQISADTRRSLLGPNDPQTLNSVAGLALVLNREGHYPEAEKLQRDTLEIRRRVLGPEHRDTMVSMDSLSWTLDQEERYSEAEKLQRETLALRRRLLGPDNPGTLVSMGNLTSTLNREGNFEEAEKLQRETLDIQRRVLGPEHPNTMMSMSNLGSILDSEGRYSEAEKLLQDTLDLRRRILGPEHPDTLTTQDNLGAVMVASGHSAEAEKLEEQTLATRRRVLTPDHPDIAFSLYNLACVETALNKKDEALSLLREAVDHGLPVYADVGIGSDPDLKALHSDARFDALVAYAKERAAASKQKSK
jgi:non-specific serine/threonine protein kinase/serine/threonine-protein kinase